jgi:hypothetical protein
MRGLLLEPIFEGPILRRPVRRALIRIKARGRRREDSASGLHSY